MMFSVLQSFGVAVGCGLVGVGFYLKPPHRNIPDTDYALGRLRTAEAFTADIVEDLHDRSPVWEKEPVCRECNDTPYAGICSVHKGYFKNAPPRRNFTEDDAEHYCQILETQRRLNRLAGIFGLTYPVVGAFTEYTSNLKFVEFDPGPIEYDRNYMREWLEVHDYEMKQVTSIPQPDGMLYFEDP